MATKKEAPKSKKKAPKKKTAKKPVIKKKVTKKVPKKKVTKKKVAKKTTKKVVKKVTSKKKVTKKKVNKSTLGKRVGKSPAKGPDSVTKAVVKAAVAKVTKKRKKKAVVKKVPRKRKYLNNRDLLAAVVESKNDGQMSDKLARMLQMLTARYGRKSNFANYTYNEDMQAYAMMMMVRTWAGFKPEKSNNPFAYYTQCIYSSFLQFLNQEKKHRNIRDASLVKIGLTPSHTYLNEYAAKEAEARAERIKNGENITPPPSDSLFEF